jgi:hypothetical protein
VVTFHPIGRYCEIEDKGFSLWIDLSLVELKNIKLESLCQFIGEIKTNDKVIILIIICNIIIIIIIIIIILLCYYRNFQLLMESNQNFIYLLQLQEM